MNRTYLTDEEAERFVDLTDKDVLIANVDRMRKQGYRLAQACATRKDGIDILYSFEKDNRLVNLRLAVAEGEEIESISGIYQYAYLYENEMNDLFGLRIRNINIDFQGNLYQMAVAAPFAETAEEQKD